jgi:hypothetical protein
MTRPNWEAEDGAEPSLVSEDSALALRGDIVEGRRTAARPRIRAVLPDAHVRHCRSRWRGGGCGDGRAAILRRPRHAPPRHDKLALAVGSVANDWRRLIGEDAGEQREVARAIMLCAEPIADGRLGPWVTTGLDHCASLPKRYQLPSRAWASFTTCCRWARICAASASSFSSVGRSPIARSCPG